MNLQLFASEEVTEEVEVDVVDESTETEKESAAEEEETVDVDKVADKLKKRLDSTVKAKKKTESELEEALKRIEDLEKGKTVKELSEEDKESVEKETQSNKIKELEEQLKLRDITSQVDEVLKESGFMLTKDELNLLVNSDEETSYNNVKTFVGLINRDREQQAIKRNTGYTPKKQEQQSEDDPFEKIKQKYK